MVRSPGFGSNPDNLIALFRLAFTMAPPIGLTLLSKLTRWIVLQKARRHRINLLRLLVGTQFQDLFHSPPGVLFTFPSLYLFTIDRILCLALAGGPAGFKQGFSCPVLLEKTNIRSAPLSRTRFSRSLTSHSNYSASNADFLPNWDSVSSSSQMKHFDESKPFTWSFVNSQHLTDISLTAYARCTRFIRWQVADSRDLSGGRSQTFLSVSWYLLNFCSMIPVCLLNLVQRTSL